MGFGRPAAGQSAYMSTTDLIDLAGVVVLRRELLASGYTDRQIRTMVTSGELHRVRHGSYCNATLWESLSLADRHRVLARAVLARAHPSTVLTHVSSAIEQGAPVWGHDLTKVHTTRTDGRAGRKECDRVQHAGWMPSYHVKVVNGVPVSLPTRCAVEMTTVSTVESALITVDGLLHAGLTRTNGVRQFAHRTRWWPNSLRTNVVLRLADGRRESAGESRTAYFFYSQGLPRPEPQVWVLDEHGVKFARVDFAWVELGVFLEFDGKIKYERHRKPGETLEEFLLREKEREERICQLTGWVCIRVTWAQLGTPRQLAVRIRTILESRRRAA
ncbi:hypothetical protein GCM10009641_46270 [Mycobacterium cookii]